MKKRLRKKLRKGEFAQYGFSIAILANEDVDLDSFWDDLVDYVESKSMYYCGPMNMKTKALSGVVYRGDGKTTDADIEAFVDWLLIRKDIRQYAVSDLWDTWNGKEPDIVGSL